MSSSRQRALKPKKSTRRRRSPSRSVTKPTATALTKHKDYAPRPYELAAIDAVRRKQREDPPLAALKAVKEGNETQTRIRR